MTAKCGFSRLMPLATPMIPLSQDLTSISIPEYREVATKFERKVAPTSDWTRECARLSQLQPPENVVVQASKDKRFDDGIRK